MIYPPSHCDHCGHPLRAIELIPLLSALKQRFHCTHCQQRFSARSFWLELFCGILFVIFLQDLDWKSLWQVFWLLSSLVLAVIDWDHMIVEMRIFGGTGVILLISGAVLFHPHWFQPLIVCGVFFFSQKILPDSLGLGDLWVIGLWSFFLSWYELLQVLFIASLSGLIFFGYQTLRKKITEQLPFLPFLFIGLLLFLLKNR